ncbi:DUF7534 family protein [Halococcus saccharolyticus]|uniref:Uncharacterized protein n=1 Tax=Halococcus saccharolyticus DSM 5350 TaxID=1227455 RepID=M0MQ03_9EURY|nr:hypothetical protein [Halococcus saccharolyticus]EMA46819.1 hypothetical protein C449_04096 [Halococcus saccharolyticus DSM 5350]
MARSRFRQFLATSLGVVALAFFLGAVLAPPDPLTQLYYTIPVLVIGIPYSYWRVYRDEGDEKRIDHG